MEQRNHPEPFVFNNSATYYIPFSDLYDTDADGVGQVVAPGALCVQQLRATHHRIDVQREERPADLLRVLPAQVLRNLLPLQVAHPGGNTQIIIICYYNNHIAIYINS